MASSCETDYKERVERALNRGWVLDSTHLEPIGQRYQGKVRDCYTLPATSTTSTSSSGSKNVDTHPHHQHNQKVETLLLITTDRVSAFDRVLASIPFKGEVLNQISLWWFEQTAHIIPNHVISSPDPNAVLGRRFTVFPIEFVVRGYITGTTSTSMWTHYVKGERLYCGHHLPEGLKKNQRLAENLVTPTTKSSEHDELISASEIISKGFMTADQWTFCEAKALQLFKFGQTKALAHGLLLVDTKYEFGWDRETGNIFLVDEIHTPDSSRYWFANSYENRFEMGEEPESIDKDILRRWYVKNCDPYRDERLPAAPRELVVLLALRYIQLFELITGKKFNFGEAEMERYTSRHELLVKNLQNAKLLPFPASL